MIRFSCESCGQHYEVDDDLAGKEAECTSCGADFKIPDVQETVVDPTPKPAPKPAPQEIAKPPSLSLPNSFKEKIKAREQQAQKKDGMQAESPMQGGGAGSCPKCGAELASSSAVICTQCGQNLKLGMNVNTIKNAKVAGKLGVAIGTGAAAALLSGGIWAAIAIWTRLEIGWIACLVGGITGAAVCLVTPERSERIGLVAVLLACVGMVAGKMLTAEYFIRDTFKDFASMTKEISKSSKQFGKQFQDLALMGMLADEMREKGELKDNSEEVKKLAPKSGEKASKAYLAAVKKSTKQFKQNMALVKKKFKTLSKADKVRLQKKIERLMLVIPLQEEMIANGEISKPDESWKELAPKTLKEKPSKEYLAAFKKYNMQVAGNMEIIKKKLYSMSDADAERLQGKLSGTVAGQISYWQKLKMVSSYWDILWFLLAISTAWGLGNGTSKFSRQGI